MKRKLLVLAILATFTLPGCSTARLESIATMDYNIGTNALNEGSYWSAERKLKQAVTEGHLSADKMGPAWFNLGTVYERTGRNDEALAAYAMAARYGTKAGEYRRIALEKKEAALAQAASNNQAAQERQYALQQAAQGPAQAQSQASSDSGFGQFLLLLLGAAIGGAAEGYASRPTPSPVIINNYNLPARPVAPPATAPLVFAPSRTCNGMVNGQYVTVTCH